jgi:hypothetical protein
MQVVVVTQARPTADQPRAGTRVTATFPLLVEA